MKRLSGARRVAGTTSTKPVSTSGLLLHVTRGSAVFYGESNFCSSGLESSADVLSSRTDWPAGAGATLDMNSLMNKAEEGVDGYMNVASAVGLSGDRDYSTYHRFWVDRHLGRRRGRRSYY